MIKICSLSQSGVTCMKRVYWAYGWINVVLYILSFWTAIRYSMETYIHNSCKVCMKISNEERLAEKMLILCWSIQFYPSYLYCTILFYPSYLRCTKTYFCRSLQNTVNDKNFSQEDLMNIFEENLLSLKPAEFLLRNQQADRWIARGGWKYWRIYYWLKLINFRFKKNNLFVKRIYFTKTEIV